MRRLRGNDRLRHLLHKANDRLYVRRASGWRSWAPIQLNLVLEDIEQAIAKNDAVEDKKVPEASRPKRQATEGAFPPICRASMRRSPPEDTNCPCCGLPMHVIGEETSERLDVIPAQSG